MIERCRLLIIASRRVVGSSAGVLGFCGIHCSPAQFGVVAYREFRSREIERAEYRETIRLARNKYKKLYV
jgi:hypothetical protein